MRFHIIVEDEGSGRIFWDSLIQERQGYLKQFDGAEIVNGRHVNNAESLQALLEIEVKHYGL